MKNLKVILLVIFGIMILFTFSGYGSSKVFKGKELEAVKDKLNVDIKILKGKDINQLIKVEDAHFADYYVFGSIANSFAGYTSLSIQINYPIDQDKFLKLPVFVELPPGNYKSKSYFLLCVGNIRPAGDIKPSYDVLSCYSKVVE